MRININIYIINILSYYNIISFIIYFIIIYYYLYSTLYTDDDHIKGESYFFIARAYHIMGDFNSATAYYTDVYIIIIIKYSLLI